MTRRSLVLFSVLVLPIALLAAKGEPEEGKEGIYAQIKTNRGTLVFQLDYDATPLTVTNFCGLAEGTLPNDDKAPNQPYYDGLTFHRDLDGYVIFSGDPNGDGTGGPGYTFPREMEFSLSADEEGILVMDGFATESHGSRFFITRQGDPFLDSKYTPFGRLVSGDAVLRKLRQGDRILELAILRVGPAAQEPRFDEIAFSRLLQQTRRLEMERIQRESPELSALILNMGDGRVKTATGIHYVIMREGEGNKPRGGDVVAVHYRGSLLDGTVFDSTWEQGQPLTFVLKSAEFVTGWLETILDMRAGEMRSVLIPPALGYGSVDAGPIPPDSWLQFEIELIEVRSEEF